MYIYNDSVPGHKNRSSKPASERSSERHSNHQSVSVCECVCESNQNPISTVMWNICELAARQTETMEWIGIAVP